MSLLRALRAYVGLGPDEDYEELISGRRGERHVPGERPGRVARARGSYLDDYYGGTSATSVDDDEIIDIRNARIDARLADGTDPPAVRRGNPGRSRDGDRNFHRQQSLSENEELLDQIVASPESGPADAAENDHRGDGADVELGTRNGNGDLGDGAYEDGAYETEEIIQGAVVRSIDSARSRPRTLNPESFSDAKHVGDEFKRGTPIVINLQGLERDLARRLVDFASGICYALDGKMEKLAPQVFLLTPDGVDVSETDRRRIEERGYAR